MIGNLSLKGEKIGDQLIGPITLVAIGSLMMAIGEKKVINLWYLVEAGKAIIRIAPVFFAIGITRYFFRKDNNIFISIIIGIGILESVIVYSNKYLEKILKSQYSELSYNNYGLVLRGLIIGVLVIFIYRKFEEYEDAEMLKIFPKEIFVAISIIVSSVLLGLFIVFAETFIIKNLELELFTEDIPKGIINQLSVFFVSKLSSLTGMQFMDNSNLEKLVPGEYIFSMFTMPSMLVAIYKSNKYEIKRKIIGMFVILGVATCLTGIRFHIEIFILLTAPILFLVNLILEVLVQIMVRIFNIDIGYEISTGLIDYIYNFNNRSKGILILLIGIILFGIYFKVIKMIIHKKNIQIFYDDLFGNKLNGENSEELLIRNEFMEVVSPMKGELLELEDIPDKEFSEKLRGEGFAILPELGEVYAPVSGRIEQIDKYKKTISIVSELGIKVLINIGIGNLYTEDIWAKIYVENNEIVRVGKKLMSVDITELKKSTASIITAIVFTNIPQGKRVVVHPGKNVDIGEKNIITIEDEF